MMRRRSALGRIRHRGSLLIITLWLVSALAALSSPAEGVFTRALQVLFEGITLGSVTQDVLHPATGYIAFFTLLLYLFGLVLLPATDQSPSRGDHGHHSHSQPRALASRDLVDR